MTHKCIRTFETDSSDNCSGIGTDICEGINSMGQREPMQLSVWFQGTDGHEEAFDDCRVLFVNFCPFCGLKAIDISSLKPDPR